MELVSLAIFLFIIYYFLVKILKLFDEPAPPTLHYNPDSQFNKRLLNLCSILTEPYVPNRLWGHNGHIQSLIYAKLGRFDAPHPKGTRIHIPRPDGASLTCDIFEKSAPHPLGADITLCVCPGIANHAEKAYVRSFIHYSMSQGFRVVILNHLGALPTVPLTSPRIFTYGETGEYAAMVDYVKGHFGESRLVSIGFSMGANIVIKYLGEDPSRQDAFMCCMSICQGYDVTKASKVLHEWESMRRIYNFMMTLNMRRQLRQNFDMLFGDGAKNYWSSRGEEPIAYDVKKVMSSTSLVHLDEEMTRKMCRNKSLSEFYEECSSSPHLFKIHIPLLLLNSEDDALIPINQNWCPLTHARDSQLGIYAVTKHGGHLGFFEGGFLHANRVTWVDRALLLYVNAIWELTGRDNELLMKKEVINGEAPRSNGDLNCNGNAHS